MSRAAALSVLERPSGSLHAAQGGRCPACGGAGLTEIAAMRGVPANSCLMLDSREEARAFPRGDIELVLCEACAFIFNRAFDPALTEYSARYEPTQAYSPTFLRFHRQLAERLVERLDLRGRTIVEVGCGQGEFLHLLCRLGGSSGIGFDPCLDRRREDVVAERVGGVRLVGDFFSDRSLEGLQADLLASKMTLEHIPAVGRFAELVGRLARQSNAAMRIFIQIPESERILADGAFWDIYYEHCNYFTEASLTGLFARHGFRIDETTREYDGQYLAILGRYTGEAAPARVEPPRPRQLAESSRASLARQIGKWQGMVSERAAAGRRIAIWGSGSKGVSFLGALAEAAAISHVVDINPHRQGKFMVGTGHPIVGPRELPALNPETVIVMNPVYRQEIGEMLSAMNLRPEILAL